MGYQHLLIVVIIGILFLWLVPSSNIKEPPSFKVGQCVQLKGTDLRGIIMNKIDGDYFIWWEDQKRHDPWKSYEKHKDKQYWYRPDQLILSYSADLKIPIYYRFSMSVPETKMIGEYMCTKIICRQCLQIYAVWQSRLLVTESMSALWDKTYDELIKADYSRTKTINLTDPDACVYVGVCKLARKDQVPDYCLR